MLIEKRRIYDQHLSGTKNEESIEHQDDETRKDMSIQESKYC